MKNVDLISQFNGIQYSLSPKTKKKKKTQKQAQPTQMKALNETISEQAIQSPKDSIRRKPSPLKSGSPFGQK